MPPSTKRPEQEALDRIRDAAKKQSVGLDLSGFNITEIPPSLCGLTQLQNLSLGFNRLTTLPEALGQLSKLQSLDLIGNQLTVLPEALGRLSQLQRLYLRGNQLSVLPVTLKQLRSLDRLYLHGNPLLHLPPEVLGPDVEEAGAGKKPAKPKTILDYYFRQLQKSRPLNEVKLLLVGRGGAGKTSMVRALRGQPFGKRLRETRELRFRAGIYHADILTSQSIRGILRGK